MKNFKNRLSSVTKSFAAATYALMSLMAAANLAAAQNADPANPWGFEKKAYKPDGTPWSGPVNVGDIVKYVLSYKPGATNSGPVTIDDTLSPNQSYVAPTTSSPGWTWGSSPYASGNHEQYVNPGFGPGAGSVKLTVAGLPAPSSGDGDGTAPVPIPGVNKVFGVFHHAVDMTTPKYQMKIGCWNLNDLSLCSPSTVSNGGLFTPLWPQAVIRGSKFFFPGIQGGTITNGPVAIGCFDGSVGPSGTACGATLVGVNAGLGQIGGVVEDSNGNLLIAVKEKLYCFTQSGSTLTSCASWPAGGFVSASPAPASPTTWNDSNSYGHNVFLLSDPTNVVGRVYVNHGSGVVQCVQTTGAPALCSGWPVTGVKPNGSSTGISLHSIPSGSGGDGGVCLWNMSGSLSGCLDSSGAAIAATAPASVVASVPIPFRFPNSNKVYFPSHHASQGPKCITYSGAVGTNCAGFTSAVPTGFVNKTMQYGVAVDPSKPEKCMLALGDESLLWRFDYNTGEPGCGTSTVSTPPVDQLYCNGAPDPTKFQWSSVTVNTASAAGTLTIKQGTTTATLTLTSGTANYAMPSTIAPGFGPLTFSFVPASGSPSSVDLNVGYTSDKNPEICYQAKVLKCGEVVSNEAVLKGVNGATPINFSRKVDLGVAKGPDCDPKPPVSVSCLKGDAVVTCGKVSGTFDVTLNLGGSGGVIPTTAQISVLTPGVTIVSPASSYPVIGGKVKITLAGATPGQVIDFQMDGSSTTPDPKTGLSICCNGKISITIPKDLDCNPKSTIDITKLCDPAVYRKYPTKPNVTAAGYVSMCHITVKTTGPQTTTLSVNDNLSGGTVVSAASTTAPPWVCAGSACTINGNTLNQTASTSNIDVMVVFPTTGAVKEGKNCAVVATNGKDVDKDCTTFTTDKPTIKVEKICDLAQHVWIGDMPPKPNMPANGYVAMCHIKVTTTGNIPNPISLSEVMSGTGTVKYMGATDPWACVPPMVPGNTPMNCTLPGNTMTGPTDTSIIDVKVTFTSAGDVKEAKNCAAATYDGVQTKKACDDFQIGEGTIKVEKKCSPAVYGKYPVGAAATGLGLHADCQITVTTTGPQTGAITVGDNLIGTGTVVNMSAPAPWACTTPNCTVNGAALNQTSSTTVISATAVFTSAGNAMEAKNCAEVKVAGKPAGESCTGITVAEKAKITVLKEALYNGQHITSQSFPIVLTCGGVATNGTVSDGAPYVQTGLPVNTACSVVETATTPAAGLCDKGQVGSWNTSYNPTTPVAATVAGGVITITNKLECKPIVDQIDDQLYVKKVVVNHAPGSVDGLQFWIEDFCNSNQNHGQAFLKDGDVTHYKHYEAGVSCQINETIIPATTACGKGMNPKWTTTYAPSQTIALQPNGETVTVTNTLDCERIGNPIDSDMYIKKVVVNNAPGSVAGMVFDILSQCTNTTQPTGFAHFTDGQTIVFHHYEAGMSCNLSETIPATTACGKDTPVWTTTFAPSQTVALSPNGETITVTNTLDCEPIGENGLSTFSVSKEASYDGQPILGTPFQMNVTCDNGNAQSLNVLSGQSQTISNLPIGTSCNVVEGKIGTTNLCPKGTVEKWATTYTPTNGTNTTAANSSVVVRVNNELTCEPTVTPVETGTFTLNKIALFNGEHITNQTFNVNLTCGNNAQQVPVADGVPYVKTDIPVGTDCDVSETPAPVPALCPQGQTGSWKTTYAPNEGVTVPATGATITITNRLVCETVLTPNCLPGTFWNGNICIPNCPPLTNWNGSICAPTCPPLTEWDGSVCRPTCPPLTEWNGSICAPTCPPLTEWDGSVCRPTCPPLTTWDGSFCKPDCPPLTQWNGTICVPHLFKVVEPTVETCKDGFTLKAGKGCVPEVVAPKCDGVTAQPSKDGSCVCLYRNMSKTSSASCGCGKGSKFIKGKGCVPIEPICKNGTKFNPARGRCEPLCQKGQTYNVKSNRCDTPPPVCKRNEKFNPKTGKCVAVSSDPVCRAPYKYNAKINKCVEVIKPQGRQCPFPLVPTPLGCVDPGAVIDLFNGGGGRRPPKDTGPTDPGPVGTEQSDYCKQNPKRCP